MDRLNKRNQNGEIHGESHNAGDELPPRRSRKRAPPQIENKQNTEKKVDGGSYCKRANFRHRIFGFKPMTENSYVAAYLNKFPYGLKDGQIHRRRHRAHKHVLNKVKHPRRRTVCRLRFHSGLHLKLSAGADGKGYTYPLCSATIPISLSPLPDRQTTKLESLGMPPATFITYATAWADSRAGIMPSVCERK